MFRKISSRFRRRRVPLIRQMAIADCGAACLAMVLAYHGKQVELDEVRNVLGKGQTGSTALSILRSGRLFGLKGRGVRAGTEDFHALRAGTILFWNFRHFVVFERISKATAHIVDPAIGRRSVSLTDFSRSFTGVALVFEPSDKFECGWSKPKRVALLTEVWAERKLLAQIVCASFVGQVLSMALPLFTAVLIDHVLPSKDYSLLLVLAVGYCVFQLANVISTFVRAHLFSYLRTRLEVRFTLKFLNHLVSLPYSFFQEHTPGDLMVRLNSNNAIKEALTSSVLSALLDGTLASLYLIWLVEANVTLAAFVVVLAMARFGLLTFIRLRQRQLLTESLVIQGESQTAQVEMLSGMEVIKAMGLEQLAADKWSHVLVDGLNLSIKKGRLDASFDAMLGIVGLVSTLVLTFYGMSLVLHGKLTLGTMMAFNALASGFLGPLNNLVSTMMQLQMFEVYADRIRDVMTKSPEQDRTSLIRVGQIDGAIRFDNVSFRYGDHDRWVIEDVSIQIAPGSRVALVGRTGCGKSTMARLIAGLYEPVRGRVLLGGWDLKVVDRRMIRTQIGIVTQEAQLFGASIRSNIALSDPGMALDRVMNAAKLACIHEEIMAMPMGYETVLSSRGLSISGGQRQRLAIARALARNPKILILDEATSHLDATTEAEVNRNLKSICCTRVVIAHRLSTIRDADAIAVLDEGKIVEYGTHNELSIIGTKYSALLSSQGEESKRVDIYSPY